MINFLIRKDIDDSTLVDSNEISLIGAKNQKKFLDKANKFYLEECLELGVDEDDIMIYDPNNDTEDLRNNKCVEIAELFFLKDAFFSLWKGGKKEEDVYYNKHIKAEQDYKTKLSALTPNRIKGERPAERKTTNGYSTITKHLGDSSRSTCNSQTHDCWDY